MATQHDEVVSMIIASLALTKGVPRDRFKAWAEDVSPEPEMAVEAYDYLDDMLETDYRDDA